VKKLLPLLDTQQESEDVPIVVNIPNNIFINKTVLEIGNCNKYVVLNSETIFRNVDYLKNELPNNKCQNDVCARLCLDLIRFAKVTFQRCYQPIRNNHKLL
jgi:hypothetical protein